MITPARAPSSSSREMGEMGEMEGCCPVLCVRSCLWFLALDRLPCSPSMQSGHSVPASPPSAWLFVCVWGSHPWNGEVGHRCPRAGSLATLPAVSRRPARCHSRGPEEVVREERCLRAGTDCPIPPTLDHPPSDISIMSDPTDGRPDCLLPAWPATAHGCRAQRPLFNIRGMLSCSLPGRGSALCLSRPSIRATAALGRTDIPMPGDDTIVSLKAENPAVQPGRAGKTGKAQQLDKVSGC